MSDQRDLSQLHGRLWLAEALWKLGLSYDLDWLSFGLTVTTPSLPLFGSGSSGLNTSRSAPIS